MVMNFVQKIWRISGVESEQSLRRLLEETVFDLESPGIAKDSTLSSEMRSKGSFEYLRGWAAKFDS
jgi:hypothetical protein